MGYKNKFNKEKENILNGKKINAGAFWQYAVLSLFVLLYVYNIFKYFWTFAEPSDPLQYLGSAVWKTTYGYWPWLDRISMAVNLRIFTAIFSKGYEAGMYYIAFVNTAILIFSMFWAFRKSGFWAAFFVGVLINVSYMMLGWATFIYPDQTVALYSLLAFIFYFYETKETKYFKPILMAGIFTGFAIFTKATGVAILIFLLGDILYHKDWKRMKHYVAGVLLGSVLTGILFVLLYNWESFLNVYGLFWGSSVGRNLSTSLPIFTASYFQELLLSMKYFPYIALFIAIGAYKNKSAKALFLAGWAYIVLLMILRSAGPTISSYIYSAYVFTVLGFSVYLSDLLAENEEQGKYKSKNFIVAVSILVFVLIALGLKYGFIYSPVEKFDYSFNYLKPIDIYESTNLIYPVIVKKLYSFVPMIILGLLAYIEFSRSKKAVIAFIIIVSFWFSFSNGGLAYQKANYDRERAGLYYEIAPLLNQVPDKQFSVYVKELNKYPCSDCLLWLYRIFFDEKYQKVFDDKYKSQYLNEYQVTGNIAYIEKEEDLVMTKLKGTEIITDSPDAVYGYFPLATEVKQISYADGKKKLFVLDISEKNVKKNRLFDYEENFSAWKGASETSSDKEIDKALPPIRVLGIRGEFDFIHSSMEGGNVMRLSLKKPDPAEKPQILFGYSLEREQTGDEKKDEFVTLEVVSKASDKSGNKHTLFVQDKKGDDWKKNEISIDQEGYQTYSVTKKKRAEAPLVVAGINFMPDSEKDWLEIKNIRLYTWSIADK